jgi:dTDP-4-dehydrorhamnose reductase
MARKRILLTGGSGQVGGAVARISTARGMDVWSPSRAELDLLDPDSIASAIASEPWSVVINCAAYTAVDRAESEPGISQAVNAIAPAVLAQETARASIPIVHVSTDYVFDGTKASPYFEDDPVNPLSVYGMSKEAGEAAIRAGNPQHAIVRTGWVLSVGGANFLNTMLRLGAERHELSVVDDQIGCPTSADDIAEGLLTIASDLRGRSGTWHVVNAGETSWFGLATHIFTETKRQRLHTPKLIPIKTAEYPTPARRPANSRLSTAAVERDFGIRPRPWQEAIDAILKTRLG